MRSVPLQDKYSIQNHRTVQTSSLRSVCQHSESDLNTQKKLIIDLRSELSNLKTQFTKLITKPTQIHRKTISEYDEKTNRINYDGRKQTREISKGDKEGLSQSCVQYKTLSNHTVSQLQSNSRNKQNSIEISKNADLSDDNVSDTKSSTYSTSTYKSSHIHFQPNKNRMYSTITSSNNYPNNESQLHGINRLQSNNQPNFQKQKQQNTSADKRMFQSAQTSNIIHEEPTLKDEHIQIINTVKQIQHDKMLIEDKICGLSNQLAVKNNEIKLYIAKIEELEDNERKLKLQNQTLKNNATNMLPSRDEDMEKLAKNNRILEIRIKQESDRSVLLQKQIHRLGEEIKKLNASVTNSEQLRMELESKQQNFEEEIKRLTNSESKKNEWVNSLSKKVRELQASKNQIIDKYQGKILELNNQNNELKKLEGVLAQKSKQIQRHRETMKQKDQILSKFIKEKKQLVSENYQLSKKIQETQTANLHQIKEAHTAQLNKLQQKIKLHQSDHQKLTHKLREIEAQRERLNNKIEYLQKQDKQKKNSKSAKTYQSPSKAASKGEKHRDNKKSATEAEQQKVINNLVADLSILEKQLEKVQSSDLRNQQLLQFSNQQIMRVGVSRLNQKYSKSY